MKLLRLPLVLLPFLCYLEGKEVNLRIVNLRIPTLCLTMEGDRCVFPFTWKGQKYSKCTYTDSPTPWCPTKLNSDGTVVSNRFGDCSTDRSSSCDIEPIKFSSCITQGGPFSNKPCLFPFRFNGVTYSSCTTDTLGKPWCSTATDATGTHILGQYGLCPSSCLGVKQNLNLGECIPGTTWSKECNTCVCSSTGTPVCTVERCPALCSVESGPATGRGCVFPFTWGGKTYQGCTPWTYGGTNQGKMWCSTRTDGQGGHVNGGGNFGYCGPDCPAAEADLIKINARGKQVPNDAIVFGDDPNPNPAPK